MRVLYVINGLGTGGAERSLAEMLPVLRAAGVQSTVVCLQRRREGVQEHVLARGFDVRFVNARRWPGRIRELRGIIRSVEPDLVHTTIFDADVVGRLAAAGLPCLVVSSLVNTSYDADRLDDPRVAAWKLALARQIDGWTARRLTDHHHAITQAVRGSAITALKLDPTRVTVIERGRDPERLGVPGPARRRDVRQALGIPDGTPVIVNVGRQEYQKGQIDLLHAMRLLAPRDPAPVLLMAGRRGHASAEIDELARARDLCRVVRLLGHREDVPDLLAAADLFAFPSRYEGLGGAVIEAMALGLPVVVSAVPALAEVVEEGGNAVLVRPGDPGRLAQAIDRLLDDPARRGDMGRRSREIFQSRFDLARSTSRLLDLYRELVAAA